MRLLRCVFLSMFAALPVLAQRAAAEDLPACNTRAIGRHGNEITVGLQQLSNMINKKLRASGSSFSDLRLTSEGDDKLKVFGKRKGTTIAISGHLQAVGSGAVKLHADRIVRNGSPEKGLMDFFGKDLADYAHFNKTQIVSARDDDLFIHPDPLLNVSGAVTGVSLKKSIITFQFASQPCR